MHTDTSRFGKISFKKSEIIWMVRGLPGFENYKRFIFVSIEGQEPFKWLQSIDDPALAFFVIDPLVFKPDYVVDINPKDIAYLGGKSARDFMLFVIVTIPKGAPNRMSANLQGPLIVNKHNMHSIQLILGESTFDLRYPIFREIERHLAESTV